MDNKLDKHSEFYTKKLQVKLTKREPISEDSYMFRFEFANPEEKLDMLITQHILIYGQNLKNEIVSRKYTAVADQKGYFLVPIKIYRPNVHPKFPEGGELTPWLEKIDLNTIITIKRCIGKLVYENIGQFILKPKTNKTIQNFNTVLMVCGGSGITPAYQVIQKICDNPQDPTKLILLYANKSEEDIWLRKELEEFQEKNKNFKVHYTLDNVTIFFLINLAKRRMERILGFYNFRNVEIYIPKTRLRSIRIIVWSQTNEQVSHTIISRLWIIQRIDIEILILIMKNKNKSNKQICKIIFKLRIPKQLKSHSLIILFIELKELEKEKNLQFIEDIMILYCQKKHLTRIGQVVLFLQFHLKNIQEIWIKMQQHIDKSIQPISQKN